MDSISRLERALALSRIVLGLATGGMDTSVVRIPLDRIRTDEKRFQNRSNKFSTRSRDSIVRAAHEGTFSDVRFDAITLWEDGKGDLYVLSGHSRLAAFRQLAQEGHREFQTIPAKVFRGTEAEAREIAMGSNILSTEERPWERAQYYRKLREEGQKPSEVKAKARRDHQSNGPTIIALSYLYPDGVVIRTLEAFARAAHESDDLLKLTVIAKWTGTILQDHPDLQRAHEEEIFSYLQNGGHTGTLEEFRKMCRLAHKKWKAKGDPDLPLNVTGAERASGEVRRLRSELTSLQRQIQEGKEAFSEDMYAILSRQIDGHMDSVASQEALVELIRPSVEEALMRMAQIHVPGLVRLQRDARRCSGASARPAPMQPNPRHQPCLVWGLHPSVASTSPCWSSTMRRASGTPSARRIASGAQATS